MTIASQTLSRTTQGSELSATVSGRYELDLDRCVVEVVFRLFGINLWRVRLRAVAAQLNLLPSGGSLSAHISCKPVFASIPLTLSRFLRKTPRDERITVVIAELRVPAAPSTIEVDGVVSVGTDSWVVPLAVRFVVLDHEQVVVAITGAVPQRSDGVVPMTPMRIDAAAEFTRWL